VDNHLIDCLLPLEYFPKDLVTVSDLGTGGGLPGVIYAILFPETQFQLFEKSPKKQDFLNSCKSFAPNISVFADINPANLKNTQLIIARGFKPLDVIFDMTRGYFKNGGKYFLLKARLEKVNEEMAASQKFLKTRSAEITRLHSPVLNVERHLIRV
jgi:16S rRNA (guanine527-N7)-methyltransferase